MVAVVGVAACAAMGPHRSRENWEGPPPQQQQQQQQTKQAMPLLERHHAVTEEKPVEHLSISAAQAGATGWKVTIKNETDTAMLVNWDESSFVTSDGQSAGRLIPGSTRRMDVGKAQPAAPLPPHASIVQLVFPEKLVQSEEFEAKEKEMSAGCVSCGGTAQEIQQLTDLRDERNKLIEGGHLYISIQRDSGKKSWSGVVTSTK